MKREDLYVRSTLGHDGFDTFLTSLGGDPVALARAAKIDIKPSKAKINFIAWAAMCRYLEIAADRLDQPYLGLKWAFAIPKDYRTSGPTVYLGAIASNMRHFLDMAIDYQKIHTNGVAYSYEEDIENDALLGVIKIHPLSPPCRQYCEHIMASLSVMGHRNLPGFKLRKVTFQHSPPKSLLWYEKAFRCPVEFNAPRNIIVMNRSLLSLEKSNVTTKIVTPLLKAYLNWKSGKLPAKRQTISQNVIEVITNILGVKSTDINSVADALDMHPKKLQRLLNDEGTSYSDILDDVRKSLAGRLLIETDISISRLAQMLDYTTDRALTTAVKRWFDMTPTAYRKQAKKHKP